MISNRTRPTITAVILICALIPAFAQTQDQQSSKLKEEIRTITVNPRLPAYQIRLVPFDVPPTNDQARVGQIVVTRQGGVEPIQTLDVESESGPGIFLDFFRVEDINFDGYQDIAAPIAHGAKWMSFNYWIFDPAAGKFITSRLTKQLRGLSWNEMTLSPRERTIHVTHLNLGGEGTLVGEIYKVENDRLRVIAVERIASAGKGKSAEYVTKRFKPTAEDRRNLPPEEN